MFSTFIFIFDEFLYNLVLYNALYFGFFVFFTLLGQEWGLHHHLELQGLRLHQQGVWGLQRFLPVGEGQGVRNFGGGFDFTFGFGGFNAFYRWEKVRESGPLVGVLTSPMGR